MDVEFNKAPESSDGDKYYDCTFHKLNGVMLKNATLRGSKFAMTKPEDIIGLTITMDCFTFDSLELSEEVFDMMLLLICKTKGNTAKRLRIIRDIVGNDKAAHLLKQMKRLQQ